MRLPAVAMELLTKVQPFEGQSRMSVYVDIYVATHSIFAFAFACVALILPQLYSLFSMSNIEAGSLTGDSIRLSAPFVFGFSCFAFKSLYFPAAVRVEIAKVFAAALLLAAGVCGWVQSQGRWNSYLVLNTVIFGSLGACYLLLVLTARHGFDRGKGKE